MSDRRMNASNQRTQPIAAAPQTTRYTPKLRAASAVEPLKAAAPSYSSLPPIMTRPATPSPIPNETTSRASKGKADPKQTLHFGQIFRAHTVCEPHAVYGAIEQVPRIVHLPGLHTEYRGLAVSCSH